VGVAWGDEDIESPRCWPPIMAMVAKASETVIVQEDDEQWEQIMAFLEEEVEEVVGNDFIF
jgi:hypothetical protein